MFDLLTFLGYTVGVFVMGWTLAMFTKGTK
jgi:hypothetical protein